MGGVRGDSERGIGSPSMPIDTFSERAEPGSRWLDMSVICLVMGTVLYRLSRTVADPDLWGHIKFGQDLWQTGAIIRSDPYSYLTGDRLWMNHEWLSEAFFSLVFAQAGPGGLIVLKTAVSLLVTAFIYRHLCRRGLTPLRAGIVLLAVNLLLIPGFVTVLPQIFTYLFFLILLLLIYQAERGRPQWLWGAPPLFALWANLHGGFLAGIGMLLLWSFAHLGFVLLRAGRPGVQISPSRRTIPLAVTASLVATFVNPYGVELLEFLLRTATVARAEISEWQPIVIMTKVGATYIAILAVAVVGLLYSRREQIPAVIPLFVAASLLPLMASRHTGLFALAVAVLAGEHIGDAWDRSSRRRSTGRVAGGKRLQPWLASLSVVGGIGLVGLGLPNFGCIRLDPQLGGSYPARAIALLKQSGISGNLAVHFDWGEYALWHLSPRIKVSLDGRRETVYSDDIYRENWEFHLGTGDWDALLREHETQLALVSKKYPVFNLMRLVPGWSLVYEDPLSGLFVQRGSLLAEHIQETDPPALTYNAAGLCFP